MDIVGVGLKHLLADILGPLVHPDHAAANRSSVSGDAQKGGSLTADGNTANAFCQIAVSIGQLTHGAGGGIPPILGRLLDPGAAKGVGGIFHGGLKQPAAVLVHQAGLDAGGAYINPQVDVLT